MGKKSVQNRLAPMTEAEKQAFFADDHNIDRLIERADGDKEALALLCEYMRKEPRWVKRNDLAHHAERVLLDRIVSESQPLAREIFQTRQDQLRSELAGENPTPRVSVCCLQAYHADTMFAQHSKDCLLGTEYIQRFQDRDLKRFLQVVKALAQKRKLQAPAVQVNLLTSSL